MVEFCADCSAGRRVGPDASERRFRVVADPCNGALSPFLNEFADSYGIDMIPINNDPEKPFSHAPEPKSENASQAEAVVKATGADLGFLLNSDGSRLSLVDEGGRGLNEELTFPLCLISMKGRVSKAVTTLSTSSLTDWAAEGSGIQLVKTRVGQSAVVNTMEAEEAEMGGEGSGSMCLRQFSRGYDALLSLLLILDLAAKRETTLSALVSDFPVLYRRKIRRTARRAVMRSRCKRVIRPPSRMTRNST